MNKNDFAQTAPMGWNSYDYYDTTVTEADIRKNAGFMAAHLKQFGWEYVIVDIQWYANDAGTRRKEYQYIPFGDNEMDEFGRYIPSPVRFPSSKGGKGFGPLADYIHSLGLKFGIHIMRGIPRAAAHLNLPILGCDKKASDVADPSSICGWNPDMYGVRDSEYGQAYYNSVISMYASWGVDFIKCDDICDNWLYREPLKFSGWHEIKMIHNAIMYCGRPIVLSLSPGPAHIDKAWFYSNYANMWRITDDLWDNWESLKEMFWRCELWQDHVMSGCYPDCDMLPIGILGKGFGHERPCNLTACEQRTMLTLWCMFGSPLMIGGELTLMDADTMELLTDTTILGLLKKGRHGRQIMRNDELSVWINAPESDGEGELFIAIFNLKDEFYEVKVSINDVISCKIECGIPAHGVKLLPYNDCIEKY